MTTIGDRVRAIRTSDVVNLTTEKFGERIGIQKSAVSKIENGRVSLTDQVKLLICREFRVNQTWLETGEGEMFLETSSPELQELARKYGLDEDAMKLIESFVDMPPEQQKIIIEYVKKTAEAMKKPGSILDEKAEAVV